VTAVRSEVDTRRVVRITLDRPERKNAFDAELIADLTAAILKVDPAARAVVLQSEGDAFCAGADIDWMRGMADFSLEENIAESRALAGMFRAIYDLPMPVVARVQGAAIGGGAGLVAVTDIAVASTAATFAFTETRLGILPAVVSPYMVRKIGPAHTTALFVTGLRFDALRALEIGLVEAVEEPPDLDARVTSLVAAIVAGGQQAVSSAKRLVRDVEGRDLDDVTDLTIDRIARTRVSAEGQEGMRAFLEKRDPRW
jgi:methylglutaconyl-CoA hydratase